MNFEEALRTAISRREALPENLSVRRIIDGIGDSLPGLYLDCLGNIAIAHIHTEHDPKAYRELLANESLFKSLGISSLYLRQRFSDASKSAENQAELLWGSGVDSCIITEHGISYQIWPQRYVNAGFFIDMRGVRRALLDSTRDKRVLNLFCYTGSLGVSAAVGGASQTVQVDINKGILALARENQQLNQSKITGEIRHIPDDSFIFLEKESRRIARGAEPYQVIIVDPPSFSRSKQGTFQIERDLKALIEGVLAVSAEQATIFATTNLATLSPEDMLEAFDFVCTKAHRRVLDHEILLPPPDFNAPLKLSIASRGVCLRVARK